MEKLAEKLGIKCWTENGRIKTEGKPGEIKKLWACMGADIVRESSTSWVCVLGGEVMGWILTDGADFAYSYTIAAGQ